MCPARSVAINDDKHQIILQAQTWGSVREQQILQPAIEQLNQQLDKLSGCKKMMTKRTKRPRESLPIAALTAKTTYPSWPIVALILTSLIPSLEAEIRCLKKAKPITQKKKSAA
jgi:hypothetical protein